MDNTEEIKIARLGDIIIRICDGNKWLVVSDMSGLYVYDCIHGPYLITDVSLFDLSFAKIYDKGMRLPFKRSKGFYEWITFVKLHVKKEKIIDIDTSICFGYFRTGHQNCTKHFLTVKKNRNKQIYIENETHCDRCTGEKYVYMEHGKIKMRFYMSGDGDKYVTTFDKIIECGNGNNRNMLTEQNAYYYFEPANEHTEILRLGNDYD